MWRDRVGEAGHTVRRSLPLGNAAARLMLHGVTDGPGGSLNQLRRFQIAIWKSYDH